VKVLVKRLCPQAIIPRYMTSGAAGMDLFACIKEPVSIPPRAWRAIPTGLALALPEGWEIQIRPRSGLALRHGVALLNSPGTVDPDYRGEIKVLLINLGGETFVVHPFMRVAQAVLAPVVQAELEEVDDLPATMRGSGGFGHTGD
jgi:dUTP pyrophosphatase